MSHAWSVDLESVGSLTAPQTASGLALRNAYIAAAHEVPTATDDTAWTALLTACDVFGDTLDPSGTASRHVRLHSEGAHPGGLTPGCGFTVTLAQPNPTGLPTHQWDALAAASLIPAEITLARSLMSAHVASQGGTVSPEDTAVFDALVAAAATLLVMLDPGATATDITIHVSATATVGALEYVSASVGVNISQPQPAFMPVLAVAKPSATTSNVTTLADIPGLSVTLDPLSTYQFDFGIIFRSAALTTGIGLAVNGPPTPALISYSVTIPVAADAPAAMFNGVGTAYNDTVLSTAVPAINTDYFAWISGVIRTGAAGGILVPRFRSEVASSLVTVQQGSNGVVRKLA